MIRGLAATTCLLTIGAVLSTASASTPSASGQFQRCGDEAFVLRSEEGAFSISAQGTTCSAARAVAAGSRPDRYSHGNPTYSTHSFRCRGTGGQVGGMGKYVVTFTCSHRAAKVRFIRG